MRDGPPSVRASPVRQNAAPTTRGPCRERPARGERSQIRRTASGHSATEAENIDVVCQSVSNPFGRWRPFRLKVRGRRGCAAALGAVARTATVNGPTARLMTSPRVATIVSGPSVWGGLAGLRAAIQVPGLRCGHPLSTRRT